MHHNRIIGNYSTSGSDLDIYFAGDNNATINDIQNNSIIIHANSKIKIYMNNNLHGFTVMDQVDSSSF